MSPNLSSFFSTVPLNLSNATQRSVFTVSHAVFSQALGHLTPGLCPLRFFSLLCWFVWPGSQGSLGSSLTVSMQVLLTSMTGVLISCELWFASCRWISFDWLDWLRKKYWSMRGPCPFSLKHFILPWWIFKPLTVVALLQPQTQTWSFVKYSPFSYPFPFLSH